MFDYGTIEDLLKSTEHMEILRNNSLQDDGTDTVKGVDWFQYKGKTASTLYVSGNSWIGFGENAEQLKIVRRDTDLMTLRREEGTIWGTYKFLRIRWEGYSVHGNRNEATRMVWDAILFDTGEICVSFDTIPTNSKLYVRDTPDASRVAWGRDQMSRYKTYAIREWMYRYSDYYLYRELYLFTPYLATINNLGTPVIKTADKTMKITYTITEE